MQVVKNMEKCTIQIKGGPLKLHKYNIQHQLQCEHRVTYYCLQVDLQTRRSKRLAETFELKSSSYLK